jgi:hypothetical protein
MDAEALLANVLSTYKQFKSYKDTGICMTDECEAPLKFQTHFKRPSGFRFDSQDFCGHCDHDAPPREKSIWTDGTHYSERNSKGIRHFESLDHMLAITASKSTGSAERILRALIPDVFKPGMSWYDLNSTKLLSDEKLGDTECFHLVGTFRKVDDTEVFIEKGSNLVRRIISKVILTDEDCQQMQPMIDSKRKDWKKGGRNSKQIARDIELLTLAFVPGTDVHTYDFNDIAVDGIIDARQFEKP